MKKRTWPMVAGLVIAAGMVLSQAQAEDGVWVARISLDDANKNTRTLRPRR